tara:strand:+ start:115 stop:609 length:495 start_codon:yes stop_codon:yes gene_type:complete
VRDQPSAVGLQSLWQLAPFNPYYQNLWTHQSRAAIKATEDDMLEQGVVGELDDMADIDQSGASSDDSGSDRVDRRRKKTRKKSKSSNLSSNAGASSSSMAAAPSPVERAKTPSSSTTASPTSAPKDGRDELRLEDLTQLQEEMIRAVAGVQRDGTRDLDMEYIP